MTRIYADYNATSPLREAAKAAYLDAMIHYGNPSSLHGEGRKARGLIENARRVLANGFGVQASDVFFTSGATEAANWALMPALTLNKHAPTHLYYAAGEHPALREGHNFAQSTCLPLLPSGVVDLEMLDKTLAPHALVAIQAANNETGVIQPLRDIADICHKHGAIFLCDAVQAVGKMPLVSLIGADAVLLSAHKFGGAKGAGALILTSPRVALSQAFIKGGGQEARRRSGTENTPAIHALAAAFETDFKVEWARIADLRDYFESLITAKIVGKTSPRINNTSCVILEKTKAEIALIKLDLAGIAVSSGSACSSGKIAASQTLLAMGYSQEEAMRALRISFGFTSTRDEAEKIATVLNFISFT
jgi:cysteine desulfurase